MSEEEGEAKTYAYAAFLSYSTEPDYALAREIEAYLEAFCLRAGIKPLKLEKLEICRDGSDFKLPKTTPDVSAMAPLYGILDGYLAESRYLIVLCSSTARDSPYVAHEIGYFLEHARANRILLAVTEGADPSAAPDEAFPKAILAARLHLNPWYDLRGKRARRNPAWKRIRNFDDELVRLAAHLYGDSPGRIYPAWQRQRERVRRLVRAALAGVALGVLATIGLWGWSRTDAYQYQRLVADAPIHEVDVVASFAAYIAQGGDIDHALAVARAPSDRDHQVFALFAVADAVAEMGDPKRAGTICIEALRVRRSWEMGLEGGVAECVARAIVADGFGPEVTDILKEGDAGRLGATASMLLEAGKTDAALRVVRSIPNDPQRRRASALAEVATKQEPKVARETLEDATRDTDDADEGGARPKIIEGFLRIGDFERASQIADRTKHGAEGNFYDIATFAAERGDLDLARQALGKAGPTGRENLIEHLADEGKTAAALELARDEGYGLDARVGSLLHIASKLRDAGASGDATAVVGEALGLVPQASPSMSIAVARARANLGDAQAARKMLDALAVPALNAKNWGLVDELAKTQADVGFTDAAIAIAGGIADANRKRRVMREIILVTAKRGDAKASLALAPAADGRGDPAALCVQLMNVFVTKDMVADAIKASECIDNIDARASGLFRAVEDASRADKANAAWQLFAVASGIPGHVDERAAAALELAPVLVRAGQFDQALAVMERLPPETRVVGLSRIVEALAPSRRSEREQMVSSLLDIELVAEHDVAKHESDKAWATAVKSLVHGGELAAALQAARRITNNDNRSSALTSVATAYASAGSIITARAVLHDIPEPAWRMEAATEILEARLKQRGPKPVEIVR